MARNRFERVTEIQPDALTLSLVKQDDKEVGIVILPAGASNGRFSGIGSVIRFPRAIRFVRPSVLPMK